MRREPSLLLGQGRGCIQPLEEFPEGFGRISLFFPDGFRIFSFETEDRQRVQPVGGPERREDVSAGSGFHDSNAPFIALFRASFGLNTQSGGVLVRLYNGQSKDFGREQPFFNRPVVVLQRCLQFFGGRSAQPCFAHEDALIDAFHDGLLHGRCYDAFVHRQPLPRIHHFVDALNGRVGEGTVDRPTLRRPNGVQGKNGRKKRREHGQRKVMNKRGVFFRERFEFVQPQTDHRTAVESERDVPVW